MDLLKVMGDGKWRWRMGDGKWEMDDGRWMMGDGKWEMEDGKWRWRMGKEVLNNYQTNDKKSVLNSIEGFSILETLVVITILGLLISFSVSFFNRFYDNPVYLLKDESFRAASKESEFVIINRAVTDTVYNYKNNLVVKRIVADKEFYYTVTVIVYNKKIISPLSELKFAIKK